MPDQVDSSSHTADLMDCKMEYDTENTAKNTGQGVDDGTHTSQVQKASVAINEENLREMFEIQNQQLKAALDDELGKRLQSQRSSATETLNNLGLSSGSIGGEQNHQEINIQELLQQRTDLSRENQRLHAMNKNARQENARLQAQLERNAGLAVQIKAANEKNAKLTERMAELRQMLVPTSENQVPDLDMVQNVSRIRFNIVALVRSTWDPEIKPGTKSQDLTPMQLKAFAGSISYDRLRALIFSLINQHTFSARPYFLGNARREIDQSIGKIEKYLRDNMPAENQSRVLDWRSATFKATEALRDNAGNLSHHIRRHIWWFFDVVQTKSPVAREKGLRRLEAICDDVVAFSLMIRQATDDIFVDSFEASVGSPIADYDNVIEEVAFVVADKGQRRGTIAYVIFGALIKVPKGDWGKAVVLEKAEAAVFK